MWREEVERAEQKLKEAEQYDNIGDREWAAEKKRWALHKLKLLGA